MEERIDIAIPQKIWKTLDKDGDRPTESSEAD
jgi:hypothetical protein